MDQILERPTYGWEDGTGRLVVPTRGQLFKEFFSRMNIFESRKNWLPLTSWVWVLIFLFFLYFFLFEYFSWWLMPVGFVYSMVGMGCAGTIWFHRYGTHRAFKFRNAFWRMLTQNLVIKALPEEVYVISHHVHHNLSDKPGDPYNAQAGFWYCFLADVNHNLISRNLTEAKYALVARCMGNMGIEINSYDQYQKWGSVSNPIWTWFTAILNWLFWYMVFFLIGGHALACCLFGWAAIWAIGVRTFNFEGHGGGHDKRQQGIDFSKNDRSINQYWPGYISGEWHNNHHLFPGSARSGFTKYQLDLPWYYIRFLYAIGGVSEYRDSKEAFYEKYYNPYLESKRLQNAKEGIGQ